MRLGQLWQKAMKQEEQCQTDAHISCWTSVVVPGVAESRAVALAGAAEHWEDCDGRQWASQHRSQVARCFSRCADRAARTLVSRGRKVRVACAVCGVEGNFTHEAASAGLEKGQRA